jgi:hypothetical protein
MTELQAAAILLQAYSKAAEDYEQRNVLRRFKKFVLKFELPIGAHLII